MPFSSHISVFAEQGVKVYSNPCSHKGDELKKLHLGDFPECVERCATGDGIFIRLAEGGWVHKDGRHASFQVVQVEDHWFQYIVDDSHGSDLRSVPTRFACKNSGKRIKEGQSLVVSERAVFENGEHFLRVEPPHQGWVPETKRDGRLKFRRERRLKPKRPPRGEPNRMLSPLPRAQSVVYGQHRPPPLYGPPGMPGVDFGLDTFAPAVAPAVGSATRIHVGATAGIGLPNVEINDYKLQLPLHSSGMPHNAARDYVVPEISMTARDHGVQDFGMPARDHGVQDYGMPARGHGMRDFGMAAHDYGVQDFGIGA